jgi:GT2 family glycosyltransferase
VVVDDEVVPRTTVVVITRDRRHTVLATLDRLARLPERPPVVLVDNASTDGTCEAVRRRYPSVDVVPLPDNLGAAARTVGVLRARTPYVAFSDDDSWWAPGSLAEAASVLDRHPRLGLLAARVLVGPDERLDPVCRAMRDSPLPAPPGAAGPSLLGFVACGSVVRRTAYLEVGGFDDVLFFVGEEALLAQDLMAAGWQLAYVDDVVAHHDPNSASGHRAARDRLDVRNALLRTWMRRPWPTALTASARVLLHRRDRATLLGLLGAVRRAPAALRRRSVLPEHVEQQVRLLERSR